MSRRPPDAKPDESDYEALKARNRELEEQIAILNDGTQVKREDYELLEKRLRTEQDDHLQTIRIFRDMENRLEENMKKCEKYEQIIQKYKELNRVGDKTERSRDQQILDLKRNKSEMESLNVKHRQDILSYIADNKKLSDTNRRLEAHIQDVDRALAQMLERNKELVRSLQESELRNNDLVNQLDLEKKNVYRLEHDLAKLRDDERRDQLFLQESRLDTVESNYANAQQKLLIANNTITELKSRISKLEHEAERAAKLQIELAKQKQINQNLENQNDQLQMEIDSNRGSSEEYRKQIDDLRDRIQKLDDNYEDRINAMKVEVEYYRKRTEKEFKINTDLEEQMTNKDKEIDDLKEEIAKYLDKTYGLPQAVNEIRQLKAMVSVRDAQIADMIVENQWTQKVIYALEERLPDNINLEQFFNELQKREIEFQQRRAERNIYALLKKTLEENKANSVGEIKVVLGSGTRHKKTLFLHNEGDINRETGFVQQIATGMRRSRRASSMNSSEANDDTDRADLDTDSFVNESESENELVASSAMSIMMKNKQRKDKERKKNDNVEQVLSNIPRITSSKMVTADASVQVYPDDFHPTANKNNSDKDEEKDSDKSMSGNEDRWVRELRGKLKKVKSEKAALVDQLKIAREDFNKKSQESDQKSIEIRTLTVRVEDLLAQIDNLKSELKQTGGSKSQSRVKSPRSSRKNSELDVSDTDTEDELNSSSDYGSPRKKQHFRRLNREDDPLRVELKNAKVQVISPGVTVSIPKRSVYFEVRPVKPKLSYEYNDDSVFQVPSPDELEIIDARIKILKSEVFEAETLAAESAREIEDLKRKIEQKDEMIDQMRRTNSNLEKRLEDERSNFQEKLTELRNDAERTLEARLKEARDLDAVSNNPFGRGARETDLADVSMHMEQLNRDKAKLLNELTETKEALKFMQRQNGQLKDRLNQLQKDYNELKDKQTDTSRQKLVDYSSGLKMKFTALQKKYADLQKNYEDLKKYKESRNEPLNLTSTSRSSARSTDDGNDGSSSARDASKLKGAMMKIEQMRTQNEEMQLRLGKAQTTIERLNQLLQSKERQMTKLQEQAAQYKHMLAKQQMTKKS